MKILVTGGAGFIGSHLCRSLVKKGHQVTCYDLLFTGCRENISPLIGDNFELTSELTGEQFDQVYHLASPTSPAAIMKEPEMTKTINDQGTRVFFSYAKDPRKFLFVSTVKIHGDCERVQSYIDGKRAGEKITLGRGGKVARLANTYGPRMDIFDSRVIPTFVRQSLQGELLSLWNGGAQKDSFCYISDIVEGLITFMDSKEKAVVEFGAEESITIRDLANMISKLTLGISKYNTWEVVPVSDECHKVADLTRAKSLFDWKPKVTLEDGLKKTIDYVRTVIGEVSA